MRTKWKLNKKKSTRIRLRGSVCGIKPNKNVFFYWNFAAEKKMCCVHCIWIKKRVFCAFEIGFIRSQINNILQNSFAIWKKNANSACCSQNVLCAAGTLVRISHENNLNIGIFGNQLQNLAAFLGNNSLAWTTIFFVRNYCRRPTYTISWRRVGSRKFDK